MRGYYLCTRAALPAMLERGGGAIVYTSSPAACVGAPSQVAYATAKAGVEAIMRHVAARYGSAGIRANCVAPGSTMHDRLERELDDSVKQWCLDQALIKSRLGRPEDIAAMSALLMSGRGLVYHRSGDRRRWRRGHAPLGASGRIAIGRLGAWGERKLPAMVHDGLCFDEILTLAERESGAYGLADAALAARARRLVERFNERGPYALHQLDAMRGQVVRMLATRLKVLLDRERFAGIAKETIERPIFIIGFPRSGTTLLHSLLAEDPETHKLQSWNIFSPSPPPGAGPISAGRIALAQRRIEDWMDFCPAQVSMHPYVDKGAYQLCENEELFSLDFHNAYPYYFYKVPTLEPADVRSADPVAAYHFQHAFFQHLQWNTGKTRWVCKEPSAQLHLAALFEVFPDALCVWPHRPLVEIYASNVALRAAVFDTIRGRPNDWTQQPRALVETMKAAFNDLMASDLIRDPRILHLRFRDIAADPVAAVRSIYDRHGLEVSTGFETRIAAWLADPENAVDRYGRYPYSYAAFGLDRDWVEQLFAEYSRYFGLD